MPHPLRDFGWRACAGCATATWHRRIFRDAGDVWRCERCGAKRPIRKRKGKG